MVAARLADLRLTRALGELVDLLEDLFDLALDAVGHDDTFYGLPGDSRFIVQAAA
jgi:hypothetical protein